MHLPSGPTWLAVLISTLIVVAFASKVRKGKNLAQGRPGGRSRWYTVAERLRVQETARPLNSDHRAALHDPLETARTWNPFTLSRIALAGEGAANAVRALVIDTITQRLADDAEIVISRSDASLLLGLEAEELVGDRVPGLVLFEDLWDAFIYLRIPGPRRLVVTSSGDLHQLRSILVRQSGRIVIVSLDPGLEGTVEIEARGHVADTADPKITEHLAPPLALASLSQARARLAGFPTARTLIATS